ncbi:pyridoxal phosphate-dependent aminotransferase [Candidatus Aenigmatarchaeota archaeon]
MPFVSERDHRLPKIIIGDMIKEALERKGVISLGHGEPDFSMPEPLKQYAKHIAGKFNHYSQPGGRSELKKAISKKLNKDNSIFATPDEIIVTAGSTEALLLGMTATLDIGDEIILPNPSFMVYEPMVDMLGIKPVFTKLSKEKEFEIDPDDVEKRITKKTGAILINSPSNPTGNVLSKNTLEEIADICVEYNLFLLSDEAYEKIVYDKKHISPASLNGMHEYVITFQSFSKSHAMCGHRVGYCVAPKSISKIITETHMYSSICAPTFSQVLATKALSLSDAFANAMVREYRRRRNYIVKRLNNIGLDCVMPQGAFYAFAKIPSKDSYNFARKMLEKANVIVIPGREFGKYGEGFIRLSYASSMHNIGLALDRIEKFLKK